MIHKKLLLTCFFLIITACSNKQVIKNHGMTSLEVKANKIVVKQSNKNDVLEIIGRPSTVSLFDSNDWFYIEREKTNQSVFKLGKSKINKNNVLEISFNEYGVVETKKLLNIDSMNKLNADKKITEKNYDKRSGIGKLLKSLEQKINSPKTKRSN
tara:strand:+ start:1036 stop:1500 length:465 start_codon:yes stop_codon:yes gene_type:complete